MLSSTDFNKNANDRQSLHIYLTEHCNLQCKHCFLNSSPHARKSLTWGQIKTTLDQYSKLGTTSVTFSGGEALTCPHLPQAITHAKELGFQNITIASNGISPAIFNLPFKEDLQLFFSLDGNSPETNDEVRGQGSFAKTLVQIEKAVQNGYRVLVNFTVNRINLHEVIPLLYHLDNLGVDTIAFNFLSLKGRARDNRNLSITPTQWRRVYHQIIKVKDLKKATIRIPPGFMTQKEIEKIDHKDFRCLLFSPTRFEITPEGKLFHCCLLVDRPDYKSGQVSDNKIDMDRQKELSLLKDYGKKGYCPARLLEFPKMAITTPSRKLIPVCFYYRTTIYPQSRVSA